MEEFDLDKYKLEEIVDITQANSIYHWLNAENYPSLANIIKLADHFQCSLEYLLGRTEDNSITTFKHCPPFYEQITKVLKQRQKKKIDLAKAHICYGSHFQKWKNMNSAPKIETVIKLADYLNVSIDYLVGRE